VRVCRIMVPMPKCQVHLCVTPLTYSFFGQVPTSAITGEGVPDLLALLVQLTQRLMADTLMYITELEATVLEVRLVE
jgi:hypothetical protein